MLHTHIQFEIRLTVYSDLTLCKANKVAFWFLVPTRMDKNARITNFFLRKSLNPALFLFLFFSPFALLAVRGKGSISFNIAHILKYRYAPATLCTLHATV